MAQHLYGDGAARTPTIAEDLAMFEAVGFRVEEHYDFANLGHQIYGGEAAVPCLVGRPAAQAVLLAAARAPVGAMPAASAAARAGLGRARSSAGRRAARMNEGGDGGLLSGTSAWAS